VPFVVGGNVVPYRISRERGLGGMATVEKACPPSLDLSAAPTLLQRSFREDARLAASFPKALKARLRTGLRLARQQDEGQARRKSRIVVDPGSEMLAQPARRQLDRLE
jgi:hypothetical protein